MTFSDLDTSNIVFMCFWNAFDNGADSIYPEAIMDYDRVKTFEQYDNGVEGTIEGHYGSAVSYGASDSYDQDYHYRIKSDGWHILWLEKVGQTGSDGGPQGFWDLVNEWRDADDATADLPRTSLAKEINTIQSNYTVEGVTFDFTQVGHYSYEYGTANRLWVADDFGNVGSFSYTSDVTPYEIVVWANNYGSDGNEGHWYADNDTTGSDYIAFNGNKAVVDVLHGDSIIPDTYLADTAGTYYSMSNYAVGGISAGGHMGVLSLYEV